MQEPYPFKAAGRLIDFMRQADQPGLINLAAGVPGLDALPAETLREAFQRAASKDGAGLFAYHHPEGCPKLRELLAERLQKRGASVKANQIATVTGCTQGLQLFLTLLVKPGDIVACEAPAYYGLLELISAAGARVLPLPIDGRNGLDLDQAEPLIAHWKPRCLIVCSSLSNPSGATIPAENRERLVKICRKSGVRIIEDEIYSDLVDGGPATPLLAYDPTGETVSYVTSYSKSIAPGLRVGFAVPGTLHEEYATLKCQQDLHSAVPTEAILREFFLLNAYEPHLKWLRQRNAHRRTIAMDAITASFPASASFLRPDGGYMLWLELPSNVDPVQLRDRAKAQSVVYGSGAVFFTEAPKGHFARLNCARASEEELTSAIQTLGKIVTELESESD